MWIHAVHQIVVNIPNITRNGWQKGSSAFCLINCIFVFDILPYSNITIWLFGWLQMGWCGDHGTASWVAVPQPVLAKII